MQFAIATSIALALVGWARGGDEQYSLLETKPKTEQLYAKKELASNETISIL